MKCQKCSLFPLFICHCSGLYFCKTHLDKHLSKKKNHNSQNLFEDLDPIEKSLFYKKVSTWIKSLKSLKKKLNLQYKELLKTLSSSLNSSTSKINSLLKNLQTFLLNPNHPTDSFEIKSLFASSLTLNPLQVFSLNQEISKVFSEDFYSFTPDPVKQQVLKAKKFLQSHNGGFNCLAISSDGQTLLTGSEDSSVRIWDLKNRIQIACFNQHLSVVNCISLNHDSTFAASGSFDRRIILWDVSGKKLKNVLFGHSAAVYAVAFGSYSKMLVSGSEDKEIMVWDLEKLVCLKKILAWSVVWCCFVSGSNLVYTGIGNRLEIWELISYNSLFSISAHDLALTSLALSNDEQYLVTCSDDKLVKIWKTLSHSLFCTLSGHSSKVKSVSITQDNKLILSGSCDFSIIIWILESKSKLHQFNYHRDHIYGVATYNDFIFSASRDSRVGISSISSKKFLCFLELQPFKVGSESMKADLVAYGSVFNVVIYDSSQNICDFTLTGHDGLVRGTCISKGLNLLASSSIGKRKNLFIWDLRRKKIISELLGCKNSVFCVDIADDELQAVSGDAKAKVRIWNLNSFKQEFVFFGHLGSVYSVKFTSSQRFVASAGEDFKVIIWDMRSKNLYAEFSHSTIVWKVLFTHDDQFAVAGDFFGEVRIWNLENKKVEFLFRNREEAREWLDRNKDLEFELNKYLY